MAKTNGGAKCIYQFMLAALTSGNPIGIVGNWLGGNYRSVASGGTFALVLLTVAGKFAAASLTAAGVGAMAENC